MYRPAATSLLALAALLLLGGRAHCQQPAPSSLVPGLGGMAQAATDLRKAGEAFERFALSMEGLGETVAASMAIMSSEFDPFGYKTAFRTLGEQAEMLRQQRDTIQELQQREIDRLRKQSKRLRKRMKRRRAQARSK